MTNKKPSWEDNFCKTYKDIPPSVLAMMIVEIGDLIQAKREQTVREILNDVWESSIDEEEFNKIKIKHYERLCK